jgi:hypothetical protein
MFLGVNAMADINEFVAKLSAFDPDAGDNGSLSYYIRASNLFKYGSNLSRGSIIPSPFNVTEDGKLVTANYMAEYNQDRFVLDVIAKEKASPEREAVTKVHVRNCQCSVFILNYLCSWLTTVVLCFVSFLIGSVFFSHVIDDINEF